MTAKPDGLEAQGCAVLQTNITNYTSQHYREDSNRSSEAEPDTRCTSINATETVDMPSVKLRNSGSLAE